MLSNISKETWQQVVLLMKKGAVELPTVIVIIGVAFLLNLLFRRSVDFLARRTNPTFAEPCKRAGRMFLILTSVILICDVYGADLRGIWTLLSATLALVALGFVAVWSVLSNISCTFLILFFQPYEIGDEIEFIDPVVKGKVVSLNFGYTTLRDETGMLVQIPNNLFFQKIVKRRLGRNSPVTLAERLSENEAEGKTDSGAGRAA